MKWFLSTTAISMIMINAAMADIITTMGLTQVSAPSLVTGDFAVNFGLPNQLIFPEKQNFTLATDLVTDTGTIPAGTVVDSYFMAVNKIPPEVVVNTSVTFDNNVLGITFMDGTDPYGPNPGPWNPNFALSDFLGAVGTTYQLGPQFAACGNFCGFEVTPSFDADSASFVGTTAFFHNNYSTPGDFARIVVQDTAPVPGPIVGAGLPGLLTMLGFGWMWWRKRRVAFA